MPLPPYLSSAASSRAHHALLVKLDAVTTQQSEDEAVLAEVERCRVFLASGPSASKIAQTLIILMHCATMARRPLNLDFALVPALQLAESGRTMKERRMGYLYLVERLPAGHDLHLMLINTIRKDLASTSEAHILAALHAIVHLPGSDLEPAVVPLLTHKRLLEHEQPIIRQRTIQAISALPSAECPLSLREIAKRIRHEDDDSVLASLLRMYAQSLDSGALETDPSRRRRQSDSVFSAASRKMDADSPLVIAAIRALVAIVRTLPRLLMKDGRQDELAAHVTIQTRSLLAEAVERHTGPGVSPWARACLFETSNLAMALFEIDGQLGEGVDILLDHLRTFLLPPHDKGKGRASDSRSDLHKSTTYSDAANNRILALRCFGVLPAASWQDGLTEAHMKALMTGIDGPDSTVRKETLRLLRHVDPNLPSLTLESQLEALRTGEGLPRWPEIPRGAVTERRTEAACRALEAVEVLTEGMEDPEHGRELALQVGAISAALRSTDTEGGVWLKGIQTVIATLQASTDTFRRVFIETIAGHLMKDPSDPTAAVLLATAAVEYPVADAATIIGALIAAMPVSAASVQELVVLSVVPILARHRGGARTATAKSMLNALQDVKELASKHMAKRCVEVALIVERDLVDVVVDRSKSRALNDVLDAILSVYAEARKPTPESSSPSEHTSPRHTSATTSTLRYDAYDSPRSPPSGGRSPRSPLGRAAELSKSTWAMGRSALIEPEDLAMNDLTLDRHGAATPTERTPRLRPSDV